jgi:UDP-N-acetylmuramyl tripeptide synthase
VERVRKLFAIVLGKTVSVFTRVLGKSGGTALPGLVANFIYSNLTFRLTRALEHGSIIVTGTNGKTTTTRILRSILVEAGFSPIHNRSGSNLMRGVASTLIEKCSLSGKIKADIGVWEIDEATFPYAIKHLKPKIVLITNLFRDQLDRYGEIDKIVNIWKSALTKISSETRVILCADDPTVASLGRNLETVVFFGFTDKTLALTSLPHAADSKQCPFCNKFLTYKRCFVSHLGNYNCPNCSFKRPTLNINCPQAQFLGIDNTQIRLNTPSGRLNLRFNLTGLYNIYNVEAAIAVALSLGISLPKIKKALSKFKPAFGRLEKIVIGQKILLLLLAKNPTGFNEVIRTILWDKKPKNILIAINDLIADSRDVSWLWDVDFELMKGQIKTLVISGIRAEDMALRLKYGELSTKDRLVRKTTGNKGRGLRVEKDFRKAIEIGLAQMKPGETLYVLPTYTAMIKVRRVLNRMGFTHKSWED